MFISGDVYFDERGTAWTVDYEGISCCKNDVVTFHGVIDGRKYGKTLDTTEAYHRLADGKLSPAGQLKFLV